MSYKVILTLNGKDYELLSCEVKFNQETGKDGRPTSEVRGGRIEFEVDASDDTTFVDWMVNATKTMDGEINFLGVEDGQSMRKLKFTKAYCVEYFEEYDASDSFGLWEGVTISSKTIELGSAQHENDWQN